MLFHIVFSSQCGDTLNSCRWLEKKMSELDEKLHVDFLAEINDCFVILNFIFTQYCPTFLLC